MAVARNAVELARTLRAQAGLRTRQPLARAWLAIPDRGIDVDAALLALVADEINVKAVERIGDDSELVDRRVRPLLPKIGKRLGAAIPAVMAAAREGAFEIKMDGSVTLGGVTLAADEVEILATPRPGTAVAHDEGLVVVIDTELTPALRAEGDARELQRAIQDLRKDAGLDLDARIELWVAGLPAEVVPHLASVARETLADRLTQGAAPEDAGASQASVELTNGTAAVAIRGLRDGSTGT
jgi:isoleucyl-tRNA synthetase